MIIQHYWRVQCRPLDKTLKAGWQFHQACKDEREARELARDLNASRERLQEYRAVQEQVSRVVIVLEP